jgi:hypothetical protein
VNAAGLYRFFKENILREGPAVHVGYADYTVAAADIPDVPVDDDAATQSVNPFVHAIVSGPMVYAASAYWWSLDYVPPTPLPPKEEIKKPELTDDRRAIDLTGDIVLR